MFLNTGCISGGKPALGENEEPPEIDDLLHVLDEGRDIPACRRRRSCRTISRPRDTLSGMTGVRAEHAVPSREEPSLVPHELRAQAMDHAEGAQRLLRRERGTGDLASPAFGAGVEVHELLPGEILELRDTELLRGFVLEIHAAQAAHGSEVLEEHVRDGAEDVDVLRERDVEQEEEDDEVVAPREDAAPRAAGSFPSRASCAAARKETGAFDRVSLSEPRENLGPLHPVHEHDENEDERENEGRLRRRLGIVDLEALGFQDEPPHRGDDDGTDDEDSEDVLEQEKRRFGAPADDPLEAETGDDLREHVVEGADRDEDESPENDEMPEPRRLRHDARLGGDVDEDRLDPFPPAVEPVLRLAPTGGCDTGAAR